MILNKNQIYVLDDEEGVRRSLEIIFSAENYDIKTFACGTDLINYIQQMPFVAPAVALVDIRLPDMSGIKVMQKIKEMFPETEVVMLTGNPDMNTAIDSLNAGAYAYVLKPYNIHDINNILAKIFEKQRLVRENLELTQSLKEWNEKLEDEVYRRTVALRESYGKLRSLYEMRAQFISIMSHELRTPATALMGFADTLQDKWEHLPEEKIVEYLNIISEESCRLVMLMSEIFEISRIQEGKLKLSLEEIDVSAFLKKIVDEFCSRYPSLTFDFAINRDVIIKAELDPAYLKMAISHILMNAIKYASSSGHINVSLEKQNEKFVVRIEDDGPGIAKELREKVFEPFFRSLDDVNRKTPGTGLGLTIARGIVDEMKGVIRIDEKTAGGKGCVVVITIPLSEK